MFGHKHLPSREGGIEIVLEELSTRMVSQGHDVTCYNRSGHHVSGAQYDGQDLDTYKGVKLRSVWTINRKGLAAVSSSFFAALRSAFSKADVVHVHAEGPAFMCWLPKLMGKRVVVTIHGLDWQREKWKQGFGAKYIHTGEKMAVRWADQIVVLSRNTQDYFMKTYGRETVWIPNGVNCPQIQAADKIKTRYGLEKDSYILYLARLVPEKGVHYLLEAFRQMDTDKRLVIAGGTSDTDGYIERLEALAGDDERITFTGFVQGDILHELFSNAYVYVLPSDVEGMPLSLLEAMSYGNCCLVSDIPECAEVVEDKAVVFPRQDVQALRAKLQELIDRPDKVAAYKKDASAFICGKYSWDDVAEKTVELYQ